MTSSVSSQMMLEPADGPMRKVQAEVAPIRVLALSKLRHAGAGQLSVPDNEIALFASLHYKVYATIVESSHAMTHIICLIYMAACLNLVNWLFKYPT